MFDESARIVRLSRTFYVLLSSLFFLKIHCLSQILALCSAYVALKVLLKSCSVRLLVSHQAFLCQEISAKLQNSVFANAERAIEAVGG